MTSGPTRREVIGTLGAGSLALAGTPAAFRHAAARVLAQDAGTLIRGGRVVNADGTRVADVRIGGETIVEIGSGLAPAPGERVIDAADMLVMPGGIDPHTHLTGGFVDDITSGTTAAVAGGITTVGTFAFPGRGETALEAVDRMAGEVAEQAIADVMLHGYTWPPTPEYAAMLGGLAERGQPSIKIFMPSRDFGAHTEAVIALLQEAHTHGIVTMIHCEDQVMLNAAVRRMEAEGRTSLRYYAESRPDVAEVVATAQAVGFCELTGAPMHLVHLSSARALDAARNAHTAALPLTIETRPLYLNFTAERFAGPDGPLYVGQPPLRTDADVTALWQGLADGRIDMLATDHAPWRRDQKLDPNLSISRLRPGVSALRFMLPIYYAEGVGKGRISVERFVETTSTTPAKTFGLYPQKGVIAQGADADIIVFDPNRTKAVRAEDDPSNADYSLYEGWEITGWPQTVVRRGAVVFEDDQVVASAGTGVLVTRESRSR